MKIAICGSLSFAKEMAELEKELEALGHEVRMPITAEEITSGELSAEYIEQVKEEGLLHKRNIEVDAIRRWHKVIEKSDAILAANYDKKGVKNYIGGAVFLEIGFAHVMNKKIYLLNPIPEVSYKEEILSMQPIVLNGNLSEIS